MRIAGRHIPLLFAISCLGVVPLLHSHATNDPVFYIQLLGCIACSAVFALVLVRDVRTPIALSTLVWWPLMALVLLAVLSAFWALNAAEAIFSAVRWLSALGFVLICQVVLARWPDSLLQFCRVIVVAIGCLAIIGLLQAGGIDPFGLSDGHYSPTGFQANRNFYGSALFLGIPFSVYTFFKSPKGWKIGAVAAVVLMVTGIVVAGTRAALVPLLLASIAYPPVIIVRRMRGAKRMLTVLA